MIPQALNQRIGNNSVHEISSKRISLLTIVAGGREDVRGAAGFFSAPDGRGHGQGVRRSPADQEYHGVGEHGSHVRQDAPSGRRRGRCPRERLTPQNVGPPLSEGTKYLFTSEGTEIRHSRLNGRGVQEVPPFQGVRCVRKYVSIIIVSGFALRLQAPGSGRSAGG